MDKITKAEMRQRLGNVSQLRDLLFGEQIEAFEAKTADFNYRLSQLEADFQEFKLLVEKNLKELQDTWIAKVNTIVSVTEDKISYIDTNNQAEFLKITEELNQISKESYRNIDFLQNTINDHHSTLRQEITQSKSTIDRELQLLKRQVSEKLESSLGDLSTTKLSRSDLADVLFELCLKMRETNASSDLLDPNSNLVADSERSPLNKDLILPEK